MLVKRSSSPMVDMTDMLKRHPLPGYVVVAYGWTWLTILPLLLQKRGLADFGLPDAWEAIGAFGPFIAAWLVLHRSEGEGGLAAFWQGLRRWRLGAAGWALTLLSPLLFLALAAGLISLWTGAAPSLQALASGQLGSLHEVLDLILVAALLQALGEEPGWRGYLLPRLLERFRILPATLLLFPVWWLWHLPFFLSRPAFGLAQFFGFGFGILCASIWLSFLHARTRSSLAAVAWHAVLNITRGVALGFSTGMFLAYGMVVAAGAAVIVGWWLVRGFRNGPSPRWSESIRPGPAKCKTGTHSAIITRHADDQT
jgi:membrane protease YdiL (CAAX protease family)